MTRRWGVCDVEDCCSGAQYLAAENLVDGQRLCIDGGSAGGYTTLACLAFSDVFKAGKRSVLVHVRTDADHVRRVHNARPPPAGASTP